MSDASAQLARSRQAILDHFLRRDRGRDPARDGGHASQETPQRRGPDMRDSAGAPGMRRATGLFGRAKRAAGAWWRHHPAHMAVEVAKPLVASYARSNPVRFVGVAAVLGAAMTFARPWKLISVGTVLALVLRSTNLPGVLMSAMAAADFERDHEGPG